MGSSASDNKPIVPCPEQSRVSDSLISVLGNQSQQASQLMENYTLGGKTEMGFSGTNPPT